VVVRYLGESFALRVREIQPEPQVMIINADVEVELMPSEAAVRAQKEEARLKAAEEAKVREQEELLKRREEWKKTAAERLPPPVPAGSPGSVKCLVRAPSGSCTRVFHQSHSWAALWDFVFAEAGIEPPFRLVASFPRKVYEPPESSTTTFAQVLALSTPNPVSLALFVEALPVISPSPSPSSSPFPSISIPPSSSSSSSAKSTPLSAAVVTPRTAAWHNTQSTVDNIMDSTLDTAPLPGMTRVENESVAGGDKETRWAPQLFELATMGFFDTELNISLLERYQGRTLRVINTLSEQTKPPEVKAVTTSTTTATQPPSSRRSTTPPPKNENLYVEELLQLENMGFSDRAVNRQLLDRYQGRVLRVVNYLSEMMQEGD